MRDHAGRPKEQAAIVAGGARCIGRAYAERYAREGAEVAILDLDEGASKEVADGIVGQGTEAITIRADVSDETTVNSAVAAVLAEFDRIDVLMNNAATFSVVPKSRGSFEEIALDDWDGMMANNSSGTWLMCRAVALQMRQQRYDQIIIISSGSCFKGTNGQIHYVTSKAAVYGFTHTLVRELGPYGITVNCIASDSTLSKEHPDEQTRAMRSGVVPALDRSHSEAGGSRWCSRLLCLRGQRLQHGADACRRRRRIPPLTGRAEANAIRLADRSS